MITLLFLSILATGLSLHQFYLNGNSISKVATAKNIRISRLAVTANDLAVTSKSIDKDGTTDTRSDRLIRKLGGYERLLARKAPNSDRLSLSHTTVFFVDGVISDELLQYGIARCLRRYIMLILLTIQLS